VQCLRSENALDNASPENREGPLGHGLTHSRRNHCPHGFLHFRVFVGSSLGMLQQCGYQRALLRAKYPFILH
jgi:hypothetical protein